MRLSGVVNLPFIGISKLDHDLKFFSKSVNSIELRIDYPIGPFSITTEQRKAISDALSPYDFTVALHAPSVFSNLLAPPKQIFDVFFEEMRLTADLARYFNSNLITSHLGAYSVYQQGEIQQLVKRAVSALEKISNHDGVWIAVENMDIKNGFRRGFPIDLREMQIIYDSDLRLTLDTGHASLMGVDSVEAFSRFKAKIANIHLNDSNSADAHLALGAGSFDFKSFVSRLEKDGYTGPVCLEVITNDDFTQSLRSLGSIGGPNR